MARAEVRHGRWRCPVISSSAFRRWIVAIGLGVFCGYGEFAAAQQTISTGTITGVVQDQQGLPIPGATVEVINAETRATRTTVSSSTGIFNVSALVIGRYTVRVTLSGFRAVEKVDIQLGANDVYN